METKIVTIDLDERGYDIYIGEGLLYNIGEYVPLDMAGRSAYIITDENVEPYAKKLQTIIENEAQSAELLVFPAGEKTKSFENYQKLCGWLLDNGLSRNSIVFAVGGGVIGDLSGFAASTIMRGVPFIQVPTSLLAQVDSSVGGKTGINLKQGKNLVGTFYQPQSVIIDIEVLKTLPKRELLAGYAEVVKYGLINDASFFQWLEDNGEDVCALDTDALTYVIEKSIAAKAEIVQADEKEAGNRALLNLGHTFGHALETAAGYDGRLLHGEAVAIGMVMAFDLSVRMGICSREECERVEKHFEMLGLPTHAYMVSPQIKTRVDDLISSMKTDKKAVNGNINFILVNDIGEAFLTDDVPKNLLRDVLADSLGDGADTVKDGFNTRGRRKGIKGLWKSAFSSLS